MPPRKVNLLEAFQASQRADAPAAPAPLPRAESSPALRPRRRSAPIVSERAPIFVGLSLGGLLLLAGAFWLGRISARGSGVERSLGLGSAPGREESRWELPPDDEPWGAEEPRARPEPARANELDAQGRTADDRAFYDKTNRFTLRAIYYANTPKGWKRALDTYRYLRAQGMPAVAPIDQGDILVLCVGAAPAREGALSELSQSLRSLPGPPPQSEEGAFAGAFFMNIDDLIERP